MNLHNTIVGYIPNSGPSRVTQSCRTGQQRKSQRRESLDRQMTNISWDMIVWSSRLLGPYLGAQPPLTGGVTILAGRKHQKWILDSYWTSCHRNMNNPVTVNLQSLESTKAFVFVVKISRENQLCLCDPILPVSKNLLQSVTSVGYQLSCRPSAAAAAALMPRSIHGIS